MTATTTTYLITGATRGVGRALVELLSARSDVQVIAGVRDVGHPNATSLADKGNVRVVRIDSQDDRSPQEAAKQLQTSGIHTLDVVIANAAIDGTLRPLSEQSAETLHSLLHVNAIAPVLLFSAMKPLLQRSAHPRFLVTSSLIASFQLQDQIFHPRETDAPRLGAYAASKTAVNMMTKRIALEEPWCTALPMHPGVVATDMSAGALGADNVQALIDGGKALTARSCAAAIVKLAESVQQLTHSGRFYNVQTGEFASF